MPLYRRSLRFLYPSSVFSPYFGLCRQQYILDCSFTTDCNLFLHRRSSTAFCLFFRKHNAIQRKFPGRCARHLSFSIALPSIASSISRHMLEANFIILTHGMFHSLVCIPLCFFNTWRLTCLAIDL